MNCLYNFIYYVTKSLQLIETSPLQTNRPSVASTVRCAAWNGTRCSQLEQVGLCHIYIYSIYRYYRRYSGIISNRRCFLGVRPNAFQIEDIAECKSSSNDQKSKNKPLNIGMIFGISSIWKSFVPLPFFVFFAGKLSKINRTLTPDLGDPPKRRVPKYLPKWDPAGGTLAFSPSGGVGEKLFKNHGFFSFFDWGMVIQTTFQIEDNL